MLIIKNGRVMNPSTHFDEVTDVIISEGKILKIKKATEEELKQATKVIDATNLVVAPGLVDIHVHFRDPGFTHKETLETGASAAAAGGYTSVICMANTTPSIDNVETFREVQDRADKLKVNVYQAANVTMGMKGNILVDMDSIHNAGALGFTDDGLPIMDEELMVNALKKAKELDVPISLHEEDPAYIGSPGVNAGPVAEKVGVKGADRLAEEVMVERDIRLNETIGAKMDIQHISSAGTVEMIRKAKAKGVNVFAEVTPQHFSKTEELVLKKGALARVNPPIRTEADRRALIEGIKDDTIDFIATDHAPHTMEEKSKGIENAPSGMIGLETALALSITNLVIAEGIDLMHVLEKLTVSPAKFYKINAGELKEESNADIVIFNPTEEWTVTEALFHSKSPNSPFIGEKLKGKVKYTICKGNIVYND